MGGIPMQPSVTSLSPECSALAKLLTGSFLLQEETQYMHVVLSLAYRGQHRHSSHLYPHAFLLPIPFWKYIAFTAHLIWV